MTKLRKKTTIIAALLLIGLTSWSVWASLCIAVAEHCDLPAFATIPPSGTCVTLNNFCTASALAYDSSGQIYDTGFVGCIPCPENGPLPFNP